MIRVVGRVGHETLGNGGANWDRDFVRMLDALMAHLGSGTPLSADDLADARTIAAAVPTLTQERNRIREPRPG